MSTGTIKIVAVRLVLNFDRGVEESVWAGSYDMVNSCINSRNFPIKQTGIIQRDGKIVFFHRKINSEEAIVRLDEMNLQPSELYPLLALGELHPDIQRRNPIAALGSKVKLVGDILVPTIDSWGKKRRLELALYEGGEWWQNYGFLAFEKEDPKKLSAM